MSLSLKQELQVKNLHFHQKTAMNMLPWRSQNNECIICFIAASNECTQSHASQQHHKSTKLYRYIFSLLLYNTKNRIYKINKKGKRLSHRRCRINRWGSRSYSTWNWRMWLSSGIPVNSLNRRWYMFRNGHFIIIKN